jgi:capsular polysaccharide transport system ATP-binding protein
MIRLEGLTKRYWSGNSYKYIANDLWCEFQTGASVALIGRNGAGKSSFLKIIAGLVRPTSGRVTSTGTISWPVGFSVSFHKGLTGLQNTRFVARSHGVDTDELVEFVEDFAELGEHFYMPVMSYSSGMKARLSFGVSMGIKFDTYLVDEVTSVGDAAFRMKSNAVFKERKKNSGALIVSHNPKMLKNLCDSAVVLENGILYPYSNVADAIEHHDHNMGTQDIES